MWNSGQMHVIGPCNGQAKHYLLLSTDVVVVAPNIPLGIEFFGTGIDLSGDLLGSLGGLHS